MTKSIDAVYRPCTVCGREILVDRSASLRTKDMVDYCVVCYLRELNRRAIDKTKLNSLLRQTELKI